ncbi:hypothetical protein KAW38_03995 [Candidatus Micrarchaeota archaeon]|nr:hypothetical protein [Candidatus Micrarchaeota archaeon]
MTNTTRIQKISAEKVAMGLVDLSSKAKFAPKNLAELSKLLKELESLKVKEIKPHTGVIYNALQDLRDRKELVDKKGKPLTQRNDIDKAMERFDRSVSLRKGLYGEKGDVFTAETTRPAPPQDVLRWIPKVTPGTSKTIPGNGDEIYGTDVFTKYGLGGAGAVTEGAIDSNLADEFLGMWRSALNEGGGTALKNKIDSMSDKDIEKLVGTGKKVKEFKEHIEFDRYGEAWDLVEKKGEYADSDLEVLRITTKKYKDFIVDVPIQMLMLGTEKEIELSKRVGINIGAIAQLIRMKRYTKTIRTNPDGSKTLVLGTMKEVKKAKGTVSKPKTRTDVAGEVKAGPSFKLPAGVKLKLHVGAERTALGAETRMKWGKDLLGFLEVEYKDEEGIKITKKVPVYTGARVRVKSNKDLEVGGNLGVAVFSLGENFPVMLLTDVAYARKNDLDHHTLYVAPGVKVGRVSGQVMLDSLDKGKPIGGILSTQFGTEGSTVGLSVMRPKNPLTGKRDTFVGITGTIRW